MYVQFTSIPSNTLALPGKGYFSALMPSLLLKAQNFADPIFGCADVEFGRIQARDLLQHLWTGPISNAPVEIIQVRFSKSGKLVAMHQAAYVFQQQ